MIKFCVLTAPAQQNDLLMAEGGVESTAGHEVEVDFPGDRGLP
ncbi:MAG: hypothetical protein AB1752_04670 [Candidatus Zixiibacteriota bacterium]